MSLTDNYKLALLIVAGIFMGHGTWAQNNNVGIGTNSPDASAILELQATDKGILIPRTDTNLIVSPATGLLIYENADNTFYYFDGTFWVPFGSGTPGPPGPQGPPGADGALNAWSLTGNAGTSPPTNFIGTTDANDWVIQTNGSERVRVMSGGRIGINMSAPVYQLDVSTGALGIRSQITDFSSTAIYGYNTSGTGGFGVVGQSDGNTPGWAGVRAVAENGSDALITDGPSHFNIDGQDFDIQVEGSTDANLLYSDAGNDRIGIGTASPGAKLEVTGQVKITGGAPGIGKVLTSDGVGLATWATPPAGSVGCTAANMVIKSDGSSPVCSQIYDDGSNVSIGTTTPIGVDLFSVYGNAGDWPINGYSSLNTAGVYGRNTDDGSGAYGEATGTNGTGVTGVASGGGLNVGVAGFGADVTDGNGVIGAGNGVIAAVFAGGSGGSFVAENNGVFAKYNTAGVGQGIVVQDDFGAQWLVGSWDGIAYDKISGPGGMGTIVKDLAGNRVKLIATESPEYLFEDYGEGTLNNGSAHIEIDPIFSKNILVNDHHPLRVLIQLEGDCNGVYVTNKDKYGFDVREISGGKSNTKFTYHIIANRADEDYGADRVARYAKNRFAKAVDIYEVNELNRGPTPEQNKVKLKGKATNK